MKLKMICTVGLLILAFTGCEKYDEYIKDYKYSAVYFATQKPLRTVVAYDDMHFKVGVALGGKRENAVNESADFEIDPSLLNNDDIVGNNNFQLMPAQYYTLSDDSRMEIPAGEFIGDVTVTLDKGKFTADSLSTGNNYAIPLRITGTSTDTILADRSYTILVVKYISPYHGTYYHKGVQTEVDDNGNPIEKNVYTNKDLIKNETWDVGTLDATTVLTPKAGTFGNGKLRLQVDENSYDVTITSNNNNIDITRESGTYNLERREFYIDYDFTRNNKMYQVSDTLVLRQAPEKDLYFEEW